MAKVVQRNEIVFRAPARVDLLADVTDRLFARNLNLLGIRVYEEDGEGVIHLYTNDSRQTIRVLEEMGEGEVACRYVLAALVPNNPGELAELSRVISNADINIAEVTMTTTNDAHDAEIVMTTSDNVRAMDAIEQTTAVGTGQPD
jgi:hypothetical protein